MALNSANWEALLRGLGPDAETAGERYERLRRRLIYFFAARRSREAEAQTDIVLDRLARRMGEGVEINPSIESFALGIARNVVREEWKQPARSEVELSQLPAAVAEREDERLHCLTACMGKLSEEERGMAVRFYEGEGGAKIARRREMAEELGIDANALRVRMHRMRARLEKCIEECNEKGKKGMQ